jgi:hypothetical protein
MKAYGVEIPEAVVESAVARMRASTFTAAELGSHVAPLIAREHSLRGKTLGYTAKRLADTLIQKHRRGGDIARHGLVWEWGTKEGLDA